MLPDAHGLGGSIPTAVRKFSACAKCLQRRAQRGPRRPAPSRAAAQAESDGNSLGETAQSGEGGLDPGEVATPFAAHRPPGTLLVAHELPDGCICVEWGSGECIHSCYGPKQAAGGRTPGSDRWHGPPEPASTDSRASTSTKRALMVMQPYSAAHARRAAEALRPRPRSGTKHSLRWMQRSKEALANNNTPTMHCAHGDKRAARSQVPANAASVKLRAMSPRPPARWLGGAAHSDAHSQVGRTATPR